MTNQQLCEWVELYVLEGLNEDERVTFEQHLQQCESCRQAVRELRDTVGLLPLSMEPAEPPSGMKKRILDHVLTSEPFQSDEEESASLPASRQIPKLATEGAIKPARAAGRHWSRILVNYGASAAAVVLMMYSIWLQVDNWQLHNQIDSQSRELDRLQLALTEQREPGSSFELNQAVRLNPVAEDMVASGLATIVVDQAGTHLIVQAEDLPALQGTEAYQVWLIKDEQPVSAGTFVSKEGEGALYFTFPEQQFDTVAITQEPDANGQQPRGKLILAAPLLLASN
jgi:anti-sigma-K factor RskA